MFDFKSVSIRCSYISLQHTMVMLNSSEEDGIVLEKRSGRLCFQISTIGEIQTRNLKTTAIGNTIRQRSGHSCIYFWKGSAFIVKRSIYSSFRDDDPGAAT